MARPMTKEEIQEACLKGDLTRQWEWHQEFRDAAKNMYRTTAFDTMHNREVSVKTGLPSGYGGHDPVLKHDVLHRNTKTYEGLKHAGLSPSRDTFPSFAQQKDGQATMAQLTQSATPTFGALPDVRVQPPWAITPPVRTNPSFKVVSIQPRVNRVVQPAEATILNTPARHQATEKEQRRRKRLQELGEKSTGRKRLRLEDEEEEAWALPGGFHRFAGVNKGAAKQQHQQQDQAPGGSKFGTAYATHDEHGRRIKHDPTQAHSVVAQELAAQKEFCVFERLELETENWSYRWLAQPGLGSFARQQIGSGATPGANFGIVKRLLDRYPISDAVQGDNFAETSNWMAQTNATLDYYEYAPPDIPAAPYGSGGGGASSSRSLGRQPTDNTADGGAVEGAGVTQNDTELEQEHDEQMQTAEMFCCVDRGMTVIFKSDTAARASPTGPEFRDLLKKHQVPFFCDAESQDVDIHIGTTSRKQAQAEDGRGTTSVEKEKSSASATSTATSSTSRDFRKLDRGNRAAVDLLAATQRDTTVYVKGRGAVAAFADVYRMRAIRKSHGC
eukprot:g4874.t1